MVLKKINFSGPPKDSVSTTQVSLDVAKQLTGKKKRTMGIKALSAKQRKEDRVKGLLKEYLAYVHNLFSTEKLETMQVRPCIGN